MLSGKALPPASSPQKKLSSPAPSAQHPPCSPAKTAHPHHHAHHCPSVAPRSLQVTPSATLTSPAAAAEPLPETPNVLLPPAPNSIVDLTPETYLVGYEHPSCSSSNAAPLP